MTTRDNICFRVYLERRQRSRVADVAARLPDNAWESVCLSVGVLHQHQCHHYHRVFFALIKKHTPIRPHRNYVTHACDYFQWSNNSTVPWNHWNLFSILK